MRRLLGGLALAALVAGGLFVLATWTPATADPQWQTMEALGAGDAQLAQQVAAPFWGDDPALWPDWLEVKAVQIPVGNGENLLVVRVPIHAPCGQYTMTVLGPVNRQYTRAHYGIDFCAGELGVTPVDGQDWPDLEFREGRQFDAAAEEWTRVDQRVRWLRDRWMLVKP